MEFPRTGIAFDCELPRTGAGNPLQVFPATYASFHPFPVYFEPEISLACLVLL